MDLSPPLDVGDNPGWAEPMVSYDDVIAAAFVPSPEGAEAAVNRSPQRRFRDAIEPLGMHVVWSRLTNQRLAEHGLDFRSGYVWGRAAALGEPEPGVVVSTFAVFEPGMITDGYLRGRAACDRATMLATRTAATTESLEAVLGPVDATEAAAALRDAVAACDRVGRPIFGGLCDRDWPEPPIGQLWHGCEVLREYRGDSHVAVCAERGLGPMEMNVLTELWLGMPLGSYSGTRGWSEAQLAVAVAGLADDGLVEGSELTDTGRSFRDEIEEATDRLCVPITDMVSEDVTIQLNEWSARCIESASFPPNVFKRAAG